MKVAKFYSFHDIRIEDMPVPEPGPGEALVKVRASGICSGDVMPWYIEKKAPLVLGHEPAGEIIAAGENVQNVKPGDRVFVHHHAPCMKCAFCRRGDYVQCDTWRSSRIIPGGIAEYILVPQGNLQTDTLILPEKVTFEDAVLVEPLACVVKSLTRSGIKKGDTILVIGLGVMGMLHILLASRFGAGRVIGADMVDFRLEKAGEVGADAVIHVEKEPLKDTLLSLTHGRGADIVIVGPNSIRAMDGGVNCAAAGGTVVLFTPAKPGERLTIDPNYLYFRDISIVTSYSCGPDDTRRALELIEEGTVTAERLVTHRFSIEETADAYRTVAQAWDSLKVIIVF